MRKKGISLIVLIITIIVIIILAGAVILNLTKNNPIDSARKAKFLNDIDTFKSELSLYELGEMSNVTGNYDPKLLNADKSGSYENGAKDKNLNKKIDDIISSMKKTSYPDKLEVISGELVYVGDSQKESSWCDGVIESKDFKIDITVVPDVSSIKGTITLSGAFVDVNKIQYYKVYISETSGNYPEEPAYYTDNRDLKVDFNITSGIEANKKYYIKVVVKMTNLSDEREKEISVVSTADSVAPNAAQIAIPSYSNKLTIAPVAITLSDNDGGSGINKTASRYIISKLSAIYTETDPIWDGAINFEATDFVGNVATIGVEAPTDGEYYIHVLSIDGAGNKKASVSNKIFVDTVVPNEPNITLPSSTTSSSIEATVAMSDNQNGSGLDLSNCKYIYSTVSSPYGDTEPIWDNASVFTNETETITLTSSTNEIYYLHVLLVDKAGNRREVLSSGVTTNTDIPVAPVITGTIASNTWTNTDVTLTVNEVASAGIIRYEYSINGGTWQTYNSANKIVITSEGTTIIKARAVNNVSVNGAESTGYIVNIDKTVPTVPTLTPNTTAWTNQNVKVTITYPSDVSVKEYSINGTTWNSYTSAVVVTNNNTTVYARARDLAGNQSTNGTLLVANIDKIPPTVTFGTNGASNVSKASTTVKVSDTGGSGINGDNNSYGQSFGYYWDTQNTNWTASTWTTDYISDSTKIEKKSDVNQYLWIYVSDRAGNVTKVVSNQFKMQSYTENIVSTIKSYNATFSGDTTGYSYWNPLIPAGFVAVNTGEADWNNLSYYNGDWNNGLVIQDPYGNQFVWVPIDDLYVQYDLIHYGDTDSLAEDLPSNGFSESNISKYKGFYIARYESTFDYNGGNPRVAVKKGTKAEMFNDLQYGMSSSANGYLWNWVDYTDAKQYSENMASAYGYNTSIIGTNLVTGKQFDTTLKWIENSGRRVMDDSQYWGNYNASKYPANISGYGELQVSGYSNYWRSKNIYDIAGNLCEWIGQTYTSSWEGTQFVYKNGGINGTSSVSAYDYSYANSSNKRETIGFRTALYFK